jgi:DNA-binding FadR family transcriptional regulator
MKGTFPHIGIPKLKTKVYETLLGLIVGGKLKVGEMLPPERILAEELGVSRTVLREAIKSLETRGVLTSIHGVGIQVNPVSSEDISNAFMLYLKRQNQELPLMDLIEFRAIIEPEIARLAAQKAGKEDIDELSKILERMKESIGDVGVFNRIDLEYHLQISKLTENLFFTTIMKELIIPIREVITRTGGVDNKKVFNDHYAVFERIRDKDAEGARKAMMKSIAYARQILEKKRRAETAGSG